MEIFNCEVNMAECFENVVDVAVGGGGEGRTGGPKKMVLHRLLFPSLFSPLLENCVFFFF